MPGSAYEFVVVAVNTIGGVVGRSPQSDPVRSVTKLLGKYFVRQSKNLRVKFKCSFCPNKSFKLCRFCEN